MTKPYTIRCPECEGSGAIAEIHSGYDNNGDMQYEQCPAPCPQCEASGELVVEVEEKYHAGYFGIIHTRYRPLSEQEVEELLNDVIPDGPNWFELLMKGRLQVNYKNQPVRVSPRRDYDKG